jgi:hypothetical protein
MVLQLEQQVTGHQQLSQAGSVPLLLLLVLLLLLKQQQHCR